MAVLAYQYYNSYAASLDSTSVGAVMSAVLQLDARQQLALFQKLGNLLAASDLMPDNVAQHIDAIDQAAPAGRPVLTSG